jgi:hypothetical protein
MSYDPNPARLRELLDALPRKDLNTGRTLEQLQADAELNAATLRDHPDRARFAVPAVRRIIAEAWACGRAEVRAEAPSPDGSWQEALDYLKACITGYDLLLADADPGLHTWAEARARGQQRIIAACWALLERAGEQS